MKRLYQIIGIVLLLLAGTGKATATEKTIVNLVTETLTNNSGTNTRMATFASTTFSDVKANDKFVFEYTYLGNWGYGCVQIWDDGSGSELAIISTDGGITAGSASYSDTWELTIDATMLADLQSHQIGINLTNASITSCKIVGERSDDDKDGKSSVPSAATSLWTGSVTYGSDGSVTSGTAPTVAASDFSSAALGDQIYVTYTASGTATLGLTMGTTCSISETSAFNGPPYVLYIGTDMLAALQEDGITGVSGKNITITGIYLNARTTDYDESTDIWRGTLTGITGTELTLWKQSMNTAPLTSAANGNKLCFEYSYVSSSAYAAISLWYAVATAGGNTSHTLTNPSTGGTATITVSADNLSAIQGLFNLTYTNLTLTHIYLNLDSSTETSVEAPTGTYDSDNDINTYTFTESRQTFANPERGTLHPLEIHRDGRTQSNLLSTTVRNYRENENQSLMRIVFYLEGCLDRDIPQTFLDTIRTNLNAVRDGGMKCILRFAYKDDPNGYINSSSTIGKLQPFDPSLTQIQSHIAQLKTIFEGYSDVIAALEAGFLGLWGEWYYSDHAFSSEYTAQYVTSRDEEVADRKAVLEALLAALPTDRCVLVRQPWFKYKVYGDGTYSSPRTTESSAFYQTSDAYSRIGSHNDAFVTASVGSDGTTLTEDDLGTFGGNPVTTTSIANDRDFWKNETKYTPMGGETSYTTNSTALSKGVNKTLSELQTFHYSYMNEDWYTGFTSAWKSTAVSSTEPADGSTIWETMEKRLGYRFVLTSASNTANLYNGSKTALAVNFTVKNVGYASPFNQHDINILLLDDNDDVVATLKAGAATSSSNTDVRKWFSQYDGTESYTVNLTFPATLLSGVPTGDYTVALAITDPDEALSARPEYNIRMANDDGQASPATTIWLSTLGCNLIGRVSVHASVEATVTKAGWSSWVTTANVSIPSGVTAYTVTSATTAAATLKAVTDAVADTPLLLYDGKTTEADTYTFPIVKSATDHSGTNKLAYVGTGETISSNVYVLYNGYEGIGFYLWDGANLPERQVYLPKSNVPSSVKAFLPLADGMATDDIRSVHAAAADHTMYNLQGQRVQHPSRGIYVVNGRKVWVK